MVDVKLIVGPKVLTNLSLSMCTIADPPMIFMGKGINDDDDVGIYWIVSTNF